MFCPNCGNTLEENAKFCNKCGEQVAENFVGENQKIMLTEETVRPVIPKKNKKKLWIRIIVIIVAAVVAGIALLYVAGYVLERVYINYVKGGYPETYPDITYGEAFDEFFDEPTWGYFISTIDDNDVDVVEFTGQCLYMDEEATATMQFILDTDNGTFRTGYFGINGVQQSKFMTYTIIEKVFESYRKDNADKAIEETGQSESLAENDMENLLSCSSDEIVKYGFNQSDMDDLFSTDDGNVSVIYDGSELYMINIENTDEYCFHGMKIGMNTQEAVEAVKDSYSTKYQDEFYLCFLNKKGDVMITAELEDQSITQIIILFNDEEITQTLEDFEINQESESQGGNEIPNESESQGESGKNESSGFIFPDSDSRYLEMTDLYGLSAEECRIARNEIYARHGRIFQDSELQAYFEQFEWYDSLYEADEFDESVLNEYEKSNRDLITEYESALDAGFEGTWTDSYSQRCHMEITVTDDLYYEVLINWSSSAWDNTKWMFFASYDKNQDALVYQNGRCVDQHYAENGEMQETEVYSNGEGLIYQKDGKLYWEDKTEGIGDGCVFERD